MIQVREIHLIKSQNPATQDSIILQNLNSRLDKEKFCGKINLTYKLGQLEYIKIEQGFTVDSLVDSLSR